MSDLRIAQFQKNCATCDYWAGSRKVEGVGACSCAIVDQNERGKCYSPLWRGSVERIYLDTCKDYVKWGPLR